jgi:hypothetical protein
LQSEFVVKDSGERHQFDTGFVRDTEEGKLDYTLIFDGPMADRYAAHMTKGAEKYGKRNWMQASTVEEAERFQRSASRHFRQWLRGDDDEDHAAAAAFNIFAYEYVMERVRSAES